MGCCLSREEDRFNGEKEALLPKGRNGNNRVDKSGDVDLAKKEEGTKGSRKSPSAVIAASDAMSKVPARPQLPKEAMESVDFLGLNDEPLTPLAVSATENPTLTLDTALALSIPTAAPDVKVGSPLEPPTEESSLPKRAAKNLSMSEASMTETYPSKPTQTSMLKSTDLSLPNLDESLIRKKTNASSETLLKKLSDIDGNSMASSCASVSVKTDSVDKGNKVNRKKDNGSDNDKYEDDNEGGSDNTLEKIGNPKNKKINSAKKSKKKRKKAKK